MDLDQRIQKALEQEDYSYCISLMEQREEARRRLNIQNYVRDNNVGIGKKLNPEDIEKYVFITFNPPDDVDMADFEKYMKNVVKKRWIHSYLYVFEQRTENHHPPFTGKHCHMLINYQKGKSKAHIVREIGNTVKFLLDTSNYHLYNVKFIDQAEYQRKLKYLIGIKADEQKHAKQAADVFFREHYGLPKFFSSNSIADIENAT